MSVYDLKPQFQDLLRPLCRAMARVGVTANQITLLAMALSFFVGGVIWVFDAAGWSLLLVPVVLFVRMALNAIDGMLAREHDMKTPLGAALNELGDVLSDAALYLPFTAIAGGPTELIVVAVVLAGVSEMAGVVSAQIGASRRYDGPMGKSDRAVLFGAVALLLGAGAPVGLWLHAVIGVMVILLCATIARRIKHALEELQ